MRRYLFVILLIVAPVAWFSALPLASNAAPDPDQLQRRIHQTRDAVEQRNARERVLTTDIAGFTQRINTLQGQITTLASRRLGLQNELDDAVSQLQRTRARLLTQRARLARLRVRLTQTREQLAARLVEIYKAGRPDLITVILGSSNFSNLLERAELLRRISDQDVAITDAVGLARDQTREATIRLARLEATAQRTAASIKTRRDRVAELQNALAQRRFSLSDARTGKQRLLSSVRADRRELQSQLAALERENDRVQAELASTAQRASAPPAAPSPAAQSSSGLIWPVTGTITSPFGPRWGRLHAGIDIGAPEGTPIKAAAAGTVVIAGWQGGYGNYTCIQHVGALSTCYAHQSQIATSVGATVAQGQLIGYVGNTGASFGAHLHFETRTSGTPVDPFGYL